MKKHGPLESSSGTSEQGSLPRLTAEALVFEAPGLPRAACARVRGGGPCAVAVGLPRPHARHEALCFGRRNAPRLGGRADAFASRAGLRLPQDGEPGALRPAPVLPPADHAGLFVRPR